MRGHERAAIVTGAVGYLILTVLSVGIVVSKGFRDSAVEFIEEMGYGYLFGSLILSVVFAAAAVYLIGVSLGRESQETAISTSTEMGTVNVSVRAVENAVRRSLGDVAGVSQTRTGVRETEGQVTVVVDVAMFQGSNIPEVSQRVQSRVAEYVRDIVGVPLREVVVNVVDTVENRDVKEA